jgi:hypothetical protein
MLPRMRGTNLSPLEWEQDPKRIPITGSYGGLARGSQSGGLRHERPALLMANGRGVQGVLGGPSVTLPTPDASMAIRADNVALPLFPVLLHQLTAMGVLGLSQSMSSEPGLMNGRNGL